jgi:hypothetical protein
MEENIRRAVELGGQVRRHESQTLPSARQSGLKEARGCVTLYDGSEEVVSVKLFSVI